MNVTIPVQIASWRILMPSNRLQTWVRVRGSLLPTEWFARSRRWSPCGNHSCAIDSAGLIHSSSSPKISPPSCRMWLQQGQMMLMVLWRCLWMILNKGHKRWILSFRSPDLIVLLVPDSRSCLTETPESGLRKTRKSGGLFFFCFSRDQLINDHS